MRWPWWRMVNRNERSRAKTAAEQALEVSVAQREEAASKRAEAEEDARRWVRLRDVNNFKAAIERALHGGD